MLKNKNNNTQWGGLFKNVKIIMMILGVVIFYFGLFAEKAQFVLSWDVGFIDSASPFMESLVDLYFMVWYILIIVLVGVIYILGRILYLFTWNASFMNYILNSKILVNIFNLGLDMFFLFFNLLDRVIFVNFFRNIIIKISKSNLLNMWYGRKKAEFLTIQNLSEYKRLELAWCALPSIALISIGNPTFGLIFALDPAIDPEVTLKVIGHQWYWTYEYDVAVRVCYNSPLFKYTDRARFEEKWIEEHYPKGRYYWSQMSFKELLDLELDGSGWQEPSGEIVHKYFMDKMKYKPIVHYYLKYDSVIVPMEDLVPGDRRLWESTNPVVLPYSVPIKVLVTSADVLHSWAIPSLGIKVDAVPGRINQFVFEIKRPGHFYGQCSELCGYMHGYMPIHIHAVNITDFKVWLATNAEIV
jgi:heme/copper-type cytochrome/quinol oxidase subunit 2